VSPPADKDTDRQNTLTLKLVDRFQRAMHGNDRRIIVESMADLIALRAPLAEQWRQMALIAVEVGAIPLARDAIDLYVESLGGTPGALFRKVAILARIDAFGEALALLRMLPAEVPDRFNYALTRGAVALAVGETAEAREWLVEATRLRPQSGTAWHSLAKLVDFANEPELFERLVAARYVLDGEPVAEGALYCYAMGKAHADRGDHPRAFAAFERAANEVKSLFPSNRAEERQIAQDGLRGYDAGRIATLAAKQGEPTGRSIFVMGLPRSGTTLVEQILTSHSEVSGGGEIDLLRLLAHEVGGPGWPELATYVGRAGAEPLARYWNGLLDGRFPAPGRVVDKTTTNTRMLGLAASVLPDVPLVWLRRDPLDCAWSCFRTCFMQGIPWSNDLSDIAFNFRLDDQLLARSQQLLGERLLVVPFEELATTPEPWISRIAAHCGLPEEPDIFAPHKNRRAVATASVMQVRKPISPASIGSAEPYREFLQPFTRAYYG